MHKLLLMLLMLFVSTFAIGSLAQPAQAIKPFAKEFMKLYEVDKESEKKTDFAKAVLEAKCYVCHQGKKKKHRNRYGEELSKLLDKKKDKKDAKKIVEAIEKVAKLHIDAKDEKSPTFGDLIKAGKLPGGSLEDAKKKVEEDSDNKGIGKTEAAEKPEASDKK